MSFLRFGPSSGRRFESSRRRKPSSRSLVVSRAMALTLQSRVTLNDGTKMPVLGLGVWQAAAGKETRKAVSTALEAGYRLIDTAKMYGNERDVGIAVRERGSAREQIAMTTTLGNSDHGYESARQAIEGSRRALAP